jgi:hypothetical protein
MWFDVNADKRWPIGFAKRCGQRASKPWKGEFPLYFNLDHDYISSFSGLPRKDDT